MSQIREISTATSFGANESRLKNKSRKKREGSQKYTVDFSQRPPGIEVAGIENYLIKACYGKGVTLERSDMKLKIILDVAEFQLFSKKNLRNVRRRYLGQNLMNHWRVKPTRKDTNALRYVPQSELTQSTMSSVKMDSASQALIAFATDPPPNTVSLVVVTRPKPKYKKPIKAKIARKFTISCSALPYGYKVLDVVHFERYIQGKVKKPKRNKSAKLPGNSISLEGNEMKIILNSHVWFPKGFLWNHINKYLTKNKLHHYDLKAES